MVFFLCLNYWLPHKRSDLGLGSVVVLIAFGKLILSELLICKVSALCKLVSCSSLLTPWFSLFPFSVSLDTISVSFGSCLRRAHPYSHSCQSSHYRSCRVPQASVPCSSPWSHSCLSSRRRSQLAPNLESWKLASSCTQWAEPCNLVRGSKFIN